MGTLFLQVVVLLVIYLGKIMFIGDGGSNGGHPLGTDGMSFSDVMFGTLG